MRSPPQLISHKCMEPITPNQYNLLRNEEASLLTEPKCTESYDTRSVEPIVK